MMKLKEYLFLAFFWAVFLLPGYSVASQPTQLKPLVLQLNWHHQFEFAGFYAAIQQGYYKKAGLEVTLKPWKPGLSEVDEVLSGRADFAIGNNFLLADYTKGKPIQLLMASFQFSPVVLLSHQPITNLKQLSGKRIMHDGNMQVKVLLSRAKKLVHAPFEEMPASGNLQDFIDNKVDLYSAYETNEPIRLTQLGVPFYTLDPKSYGIQGYSDLVFTSQFHSEHYPADVARFRNATIQGWQYAMKHPDKIVDYILANYPVKKSRKALLAEANVLSAFVQTGSVDIGKIYEPKLMASAVEARDEGLITVEEFNDLDINSLLFDHSKTVFTREELEYLRAHPVIKIGNDSYWEPFEFIDKKGKYSGIAADYFVLFSKRLGVKFEPAKNLLWSDVVEQVKAGEIPIYSCAVATDERKKYMNFTKPYLSFPLVLASKRQHNFVDGYEQLNGKTVAVVKGYWSHEWLAVNYPKIKLLMVDSVEEGLKAVLSNKAFVYAGNLAAINFAIKRYGLDGLHMNTDSRARFELSIAVNKDNPILFSILSKALDSVTLNQKNRIYNKWIHLELLEKTDHTMLIKVILFALFIGVFLCIIMLYMYQQKRKQKSYIDQVNDLSLATYTDIKTRKILWVSNRFLKMVGCEKEDLLGQSHDVLRHPDVDDEKYDQIYRTLEKGKVWSGELQGRRKNGKPYWVEATGTPEYKKGEVVGIWTTRIDITDKKRLEVLAIKDTLTGLYNRNHFTEVFESHVHKAGRQHASFSMAMFDIDHFKKVNDFYGHQKGDEVLKQVASLAKQHFHRANDLLFRIGGEEFMILSDFESLEEFTDYLEQLRKKIECLGIANPESELKLVTVSIGGVYCQYAQQACANQLYSLVDKMLYQAKEQGRNTVVMNGSYSVCAELHDECCQNKT